MTALIIASPDDVHAKSVAFELRAKGYPFAIIPSSAFPDRSQIRFAAGNTLEAWIDTHTLHDDVELDCPAAISLSGTSVWWRRPDGHNSSSAPTHPKVREFVSRENRQALAGSILACSRSYFNDFGSSLKASYKPYQLALARSIGFSVPNTLITSSPDEVRAFASLAKDGLIYKAFTGVDFGLFETRMVDEAVLKDLSNLRVAPMIFQHHIGGSIDLRVTVVGSRVFAAALHFKEGRHPVDSRIDRYRIEPFELPIDTAEMIRIYVRKLGLTYAALDFRIDMGGALVFFEINPEGQFLWIEIETGLPISDAIAELMVAGR